MITFASESDWLDYRASWLPDGPRIGASEVASILGFGFRTPLEVYAAKRGVEIPVDAATAAMFRQGHEDESPLAAWFEREHGCTLEDPGPYTVFESPQYPWLFCTPDRLWAGVPVELKSPRHHLADWDDQPPAQYWIQLQIQMHCLGADSGVIAARLTPERDWLYESDPQYVVDIIPQLEAFRRCCVEENPPHTSGRPQDARVIARLHPEPNGAVVDLPDYEGLADSLESLRQRAEDAERMYQQKRQQIMLAMGESTFARCGSKFFSYKRQTREGKVTVPRGYAKALEIANIPHELGADSEFRVLREIKKLPKGIQE